MSNPERLFFKTTLIPSHYMMPLTLVLPCDVGCEEYAMFEVNELLKKDAVIRNGYVIVPDCSLRDAALLCYRSQLASRVLVLIAEGTVQEPESIRTQAFLDFTYKDFLKEAGCFRVECDRQGEHSFQSPDVEMMLGKELEARGMRVELKRPDMVIHCHIRDETYVLGVDLAGRDLGKRDYKVFHTRQSMRGTIMYAALKSAGYTGKETLIDPSCIDGTIAIEAALYASRRSPQRFRRDFAFLTMPRFKESDWGAFFAEQDGIAAPTLRILGFSPLLRSLKMARQNAKLAGVEDVIALTRCELSWLDTKLEKSSVDMFVTVPPSSGKANPLKDVEQLQDDLFKQAGYSLKQKGVVLLVAEKRAEFLNAADRHGFTLSDEKKVWMGGKELFFLKFTRRSSR